MTISRRNFIKAGAAGTTALGISGSLFSKKWFQTAAAKMNLQKSWPTLTIQPTAVDDVLSNVR